MKWIKIKNHRGEFYTPFDGRYVKKYLKDVTLDDLNDPDRSIDFTRHSEYIQEYLDKDGSESIDLPSGVYTLRAPNNWEDVKLFKVETTQVEKLFKLDAVTQVLENFKEFLSCKAVYDETHLMYKRGVLLYGPPGTGKTSAINMILQEVVGKDHLVVYIPGCMPDAFVDALREDPRFKILIFEELTENLGKISMGKFLTFLDGESSLSNCYILATTNYPESLPGNIVERPGRFDSLIKIDYLGRKDRQQYMEKLLKRKVTKKELDITEGLSISFIKEMVLISKIKKISLIQANDKVQQHKKVVKDSFSQSKNKVGFNADEDDN